jgi:A/G-specific adenine glycosylase
MSRQITERHNGCVNLGRRITIRVAEMTSESLRPESTSELRSALLAWYDQHKRDLPWRKNRDPYHVWVSEIMLQQTRVAVVINRYEQFLRRFPNVKTLAAARESAVLAEWSGLGYYRRARNLHVAARTVAKRNYFPANAESWQELPGIGRYTAAAISSISAGESVAVVDGNVERVLGRLLGGKSVNPWIAAQELLDQERPGDFNQGMMELGATVCLPAEPLCADCPLRKFCRTRGRGKSPNGNPRQQKREIAYILARRANEILLVRRPRTYSLMPGMLELPEISELHASDLPLFSVRHSITITDYRVQVISRTKNLPRGQWAVTSRLNQLPLTGLTKKILRKASIIQ